MRYETILRSALVVCVLAVLPASAASPQGMKESRSYMTRGSTLEVDGKMLGTMQSVEGGYAKGEVVALAVGPEEFPLKHIANVRYEPITVRGDLGSLDDLAKRALGPVTRVSGRVTTVTMGGKAGSSLEFFDAIPTKFALSDLDGASKEPCYIEVTLTPERTRRVEAAASGDAKLMADRQKRCMRSNFAVKIPSVMTNGVTKVEGVAMTREVAADNTGAVREPTKHPTKATIPNVVLTLSEATAKDFWNWYESFVIKGDNGQDKEKSIEIQVMGGDMKPALTLQGTGVGIVAMRPVSGGPETIARVEVELYVDRWAIVGTP